MALVPTTLAEWLRERALFAQEDDAALRASWGDISVESEAVSPLAVLADAQAEVVRQRAFLGQPLAEETIEVAGDHSGLLGKAQRIACDRAGYAGAPLVFVIGIEQPGGGVTRLTVLRRMSEVA